MTHDFKADSFRLLFLAMMFTPQNEHGTWKGCGNGSMFFLFISNPFQVNQPFIFGGSKKQDPQPGNSAGDLFGDAEFDMTFWKGCWWPPTKGSSLVTAGSSPGGDLFVGILPGDSSPFGE